MTFPPHLSQAACENPTEFIPFRPAELKAFRRRRKLSGAKWAEKNIVVPIGSRQGLYQHKNNPPLYGILEMGARSSTRVLVIGKGIQTGGTLGIYILVLREADYSTGGDNALVVMADERTGKKLFKGRLQKMIDKSPALSAIKSCNPDDTTLYSIALADGFTIDLGWASSEMSVSSESYRIVVLDELSKYKNRGNIADAKGRTSVYPETRKLFVLSSPAVDSDDPNKRDPLLAEIESCDVWMDYYVPCPHCGVEQVMIFENFKWPEQPGLLPGTTTSNPAEIRRHKSAWYECSGCKGRWNDYQRDRAVLAAMKTGWRPSIPGMENPESIYCHYPSWLSPYMSLSEVAARWLEAQGDDEKLQKWHNLIAGATYRREIKERREDEILALANLAMPREIVPAGVSRLMLLVDTQAVGFYYEVVAWGYGKDLESWQVDHGFRETFEQLKDLSEKRFKTAKGIEHGIFAAFIDSGGGTNPSKPKHSRTKEVYEFCSDNPLFKPLKGARDGAPWRITRLDYYPSREGKKVPIPGGLNLYTINTTMYKNQLAGKLKLKHNALGAFHLHAETANDMVYAKQMCVEYQDESGHWICPGGKPNHFWDIAVYRYAAADITRQREKKPPQEQPEQLATAPRVLAPQPGQLPNWFSNRR
jgi:terminase, large subunit